MVRLGALAAVAMVVLLLRSSAWLARGGSAFATSGSRRPTAVQLRYVAMVQRPATAKHQRSHDGAAASSLSSAGSFAAAALFVGAAVASRTGRSLRRGGDRSCRAKTLVPRAGWPWEDDDPYSRCTALKLQIGMTFTKSLLDSLNKMAETADTDSDEGLHQLMLDVVLALRRNQSAWRYANCERLDFSEEDEREANATMQRWGLEGQSKWGDGQWDDVDKTAPKGVTEYLVITMLVSCYGLICPEEEKLRVRGITDLSKVLDAIAGVQADQLMQIDVQWIPEEDGDSLSAMEVTMKFPELVML